MEFASLDVDQNEPRLQKVYGFVLTREKHLSLTEVSECLHAFPITGNIENRTERTEIVSTKQRRMSYRPLSTLYNLFLSNAL